MPKCVLIVEPDEGARKALSTMFASFRGWEPKSAPSLSEAYAACAANQIDLIVTESTMPDGSGFDLISKTRTQSNVPKIVVIAKSCALPPREVLELGADAFFRKPVNRAEILEFVQNAFPNK